MTILRYCKPALKRGATVKGEVVSVPRENGGVKDKQPGKTPSFNFLLRVYWVRKIRKFQAAL